MDYHKELKKSDGRVLRAGGPRDVQRKQAMDSSYGVIVKELKDQIRLLQMQVSTGTAAGPTPEAIDTEIRRAVKDAIRETKQYYEKLLAESKEKEQNLLQQLQGVYKEVNETLEKEKVNYRANYEDKLKRLEERYNETISQQADRLKLAEERLNAKDETIEGLRKDSDSMIKQLIEDHTRKMEELSNSLADKGYVITDQDSDRPQIEEVFVDPLEADSGSGLEPHIDIEDVSINEKEAMKDKVNKLRDLIGGLNK